MKFKQYMANLNKVLEEYPDTAEMEVHYSSDDEGNSYTPVHFKPSIMEVNEFDEVVDLAEEDDGTTYRQILVIN